MTLQDVTVGIHCDSVTVSHVRGTSLDFCSLSLQNIYVSNFHEWIFGGCGGVVVVLFVCLFKHSEVLSLDTPYCLCFLFCHIKSQ